MNKTRNSFRSPCSLYLYYIGDSEWQECAQKKGEEKKKMKEK